jgi:hypothetical protein
VIILIKKTKFALIAFTPPLTILIAIVVFFLLNIIIDLFTILLIIVIGLPYSIAFFVEYSLRGDDNSGDLSDYELNLIQENQNLIRTLEIIIISFSLLFGLFTAIEIDLRLAGVPSSTVIRLFSTPFGFDFFMATFVFIQVQVLGKDAYLTEAEIESLTIGVKKTKKTKNLVIKLRLANFTRKGCYYSLLIQIALIYPII